MAKFQMRYNNWLENFLVTGGAGYIGGVAAEMLLNESHEVAVFDNLERPAARRWTPAGVHPGRLTRCRTD